MNLLVRRIRRALRAWARAALLAVARIQQHRAQIAIRLSGEDVQKLKTQVREDHFGVKGKKRDEIKPMKKGLFGFGKKNDDDDFLIDSDDDGDDDDDLFE